MNDELFIYGLLLLKNVFEIEMNSSNINFMSDSTDEIIDLAGNFMISDRTFLLFRGTGQWTLSDSISMIISSQGYNPDAYLEIEKGALITNGKTKCLFL